MQSNQLKSIVPICKPFVINSLQKKSGINLFNVTSDFFILLKLTTFDGIIGLDLLNLVKGKKDLSKGRVEHDFGVEKLFFYKCKNVHHNIALDNEIPSAIRDRFYKIMKRKAKACFNVIVTIRT